MSAFGIPGIGGSLGVCAICGGDFATGVLMDLCGHDSGIRSFAVGDTTMCAHEAKCFDALKDSVVDGIPDPAKLPDGPLRRYIEKAVTHNAALDARS